MREKDNKVIYYQDELNDDFSNNGIKVKRIEKFKYNRSLFYRITANIFRYVFAIPALFIINKLIYRVKVIDKKKLKPLRHKPYFVYSNHVLPFDPIVPPVCVNPMKFTTILASDETFSINSFVTGIVSSLGAIPLPKNVNMMKDFDSRIKYEISKKHKILVYPEMHIWPYCNWIRKFNEQTLHYPAQYNIPVVVITTTFKKCKYKKPRPIIYIDGPYYPNPLLSLKDRTIDLYEKVYKIMVTNTQKFSDETHIKYIKKAAD